MNDYASWVADARIDEQVAAPAALTSALEQVSPDVTLTSRTLIAGR